MARHSRKTSAAVSRTEREPEQRSRTEKSGRATVHEFPGRKREPREKAVRSRQSGAGSSKQSGVRSQEAAQRGKVEDLRRGGAQAEPSREIKSRFAGDGKADQQGWVEEKSKSKAAQGRIQEQQGSQSRAQHGKLKEPKPPFPAQHQPRPGLEAKLQPKPRYEGAQYRAAQKLKDKVALITGGDSGIGRAVAVLYAREGADVAIVYLPEEQVDAEETRRAVKAAGRECLLLPGDVTDPEFCGEAVERAVEEFGKLDILVNNAAFQQHQEKIEDVSNEQFEHTFRTNIFGYFYMAKAARRKRRRGEAISSKR